MNKQTLHTRRQRFLTEMRSTFKSMDTEEKWDIWVVRPIGFVEACICRKLHVHPNAITIVSILFGAASGYFFFPGNAEMVLIGALLLFFANTLDSADGQLARMTKQYTMLGRVLDGFAGDVWFFSVYLFLMLRMAAMPIPFTTMEWGWLSFVLVPLCGLVFHSTQSTIADYYRNIHLHFLAGRDYTELVRSSELTARRKAITSWSGWFEWIWLYFYAGYTRKQERQTPRLQRLLHAVGERKASELPNEFLHEFRAKSLPLMPMTNILTFNSRFFALVISMFLGMPWLYLFYEMVVLGALFCYMRHRHEAMCDELYSKWFAHES
jgi:phosphatidylglycerophosphate synthase